jgi:hypothetical protein
MAQGHTMKFGFRDGVLSMAIFAGVIFALSSIDPNVRERLSDMFVGGGLSHMGDKLGDLGGALWMAARSQSIENAPLVVFATVGVLLTVFMLRS